MGNHITIGDLNIQGGVLRQQVHFQPGLNLLSGENGTLKTKALQALKGGQVTLHDPSSPCRRQAVSPKRNAQRRAFSQIFEQSRRNNTKLDGLINERNINDAQFEDYPALGDLYYVVYDDFCKDGGEQVDKMNQTTRDFNTVIQRIFPQYELVARWNESTGSPDIVLQKHGSIKVPLEGLSLGEQEILSLAINIYSSRDRYDTFLIDEPEVHLNWHLEEKLFDFFDDYCEQYRRQMIIVTHSRTVFTRRFYPKSQFFSWSNDGRVEIRREISGEQRRRIAGNAIEIIQMGSSAKPTVFVEDHRQAVVVEEMAHAFDIEIGISECGTKANVRSLYTFSKTEPGWKTSLFLEDGDNEGDPHPNDSTFIHLHKYCIENYLLDKRYVAKVGDVTEDQAQKWILDSILDNSDKIFRKNKFFEFLIEHLQVDHLSGENLAKLDASTIINSLVSRIGSEFREYCRKYIQYVCADKNAREVLPQELIDAFEAIKTG